MNKIFLTVLSCSLALPAVMAQTLTYQLLPDSTITPQSGGVPAGPSQQLSGSFTWVLSTPSDIQDSDAFNVTALNFSSSYYSLSLAGGGGTGSTEISAGGETTFSADVNWAGAAQNPWYLGSFAGSFAGPIADPAKLTFSAGVGPLSGGIWSADLYIDATLVNTSPALVVVTNTVSINATAWLQGGTNVVNGVTVIATPSEFVVNTKRILAWLAADEYAEGNYYADTFPAGAKLVVVGSYFQVLNKQNELLVDVSDIVTSQNDTNNVISAKIKDATGLYYSTAVDRYLSKLVFDDTAIAGGASIKFSLSGLMTTTTTDTAPGRLGGYTESVSSDLPNAAGAGQFQAVPCVLTGSVTAAGKAQFTE